MADTDRHSPLRTQSLLLQHASHTPLLLLLQLLPHHAAASPAARLVTHLHSSSDTGTQSLRVHITALLSIRQALPT
jgi:hypothetical protein